ncbi:hypothetical protein CCUS01_09323 [Colletotrichum cuscutae]|uniref:Uncharacterized protein n=1 Tax=Colletotrichum cuscutae TaxID=1209917 RepID=A0AAI9UM20_9PEZI|nr:hypothetical protein CCUS01_09323 [Colletotrichum cuscutae]
MAPCRRPGVGYLLRPTESYQRLSAWGKLPGDARVWRENKLFSLHSNSW